MTKTIAWIAGRFDQVGGGERLIQEGLRYYRSQGYRVIVFTWAHDEVVSFDGEYEPAEVVIVSPGGQGKSAGRALTRLANVPRLRRLLVENKVDMVFVQSEYDVALAYLATRGLNLPYRFLIFGQNYQFPDDYAKYTLAFRRHLKTIVNSYEGYRQTVSLTPPRISPLNRVAMEVISLIRLRAVSAADRLFVFSSQVAWETELLFGRAPALTKGAFRRADIGRPVDVTPVLQRHDLTSRKYVLSICRLVPKKRVDLIIAAFARSTLPDFDLVIGGDGPERGKLEALAGELGLAGRVRFIGRVANQDMRPLKHAARLFVSMDIGDYDLSPLEALVLGTPILVAEEFHADEALRATPGVIVCAANAETVSGHMPALVNERARPSAALLESYTWESYFTQLAAQ